MKLGMTSLTFGDRKIEDVIMYAKTADIDGIEWGVGENHVHISDKQIIGKIKKLSAENGLEIFSLGSYCEMYDRDECMLTLETAKMLSAPIIRVWAGSKGTDACGSDEYKTIVENTKYMAERARDCKVKIGFEYHGDTLTDTADGAARLIKNIGMKNVGLYWQPDECISREDNIINFNKVKPYLVGNLHVQNYTPQNGYMMLSEIKDDLQTYYGSIRDGKLNLLIEFVKDAALENLISDANILRKIINGGLA